MRTITFLLVLALQLHAENWPGWRGPRGWFQHGKERAGEMGATENIAWKTAIPGEGHSSPVIYGDQVFLLSCLPETGARVDQSRSNTGKPLWQRTVIKTPLETIHRLNSRAWYAGYRRKIDLRGGDES